MMAKIKKNISILALIVFCSALFTACGSGQSVHCAAYASNETIDTNAN